MDAKLFRQGETISEFLESPKDSRAKFLQHLEESTFNDSPRARLAQLKEAGRQETIRELLALPAD